MKLSVQYPDDGHNPRSLLYVYKDPRESHCYWFHGLCFAEFVTALQLRSTLFLLASGDLDCPDEDPHTRLNFVTAPDLAEFSRQNIYKGTGDLIFVDTSHKKIPPLSSRDLAALLYMGHTFQPLVSPFFAKLKNKFAYLAHDDGWLLRLYMRDKTALATLLENVAILKSAALGKPIPTTNLGKQLLADSPRGVLLDLRTTPEISFPGKFINMDELLNSL